MPFLRFTRDKRGYETTSLVHAVRGRHGRTRQKLLYWFRTPPGVKVGRPALDEEAIRWIEEHNPDIDFDWQKILETTPAPAPADDARGRRPRRGKTDRRAPAPERQAQRRPPPAAPAVPPEIPSVPDQDVLDADVLDLDVVDVEDEIVATGTGEAEESGGGAEGPEGPEGDEAEEAPEEQALEELTHPDAEPLPAAAKAGVEAVVGGEQLIRLRARYAELQARITERGGEAAQIETLRAQAEPLNPDSWVTADEVKKGLEEFETRIREVRAALGLRRRRRSRRGGRRRHGSRPGQDAQSAQTTTADPASDSPDEAGLKPGPASDDEPEPGPTSDAPKLGPTSDSGSGNSET